MGFVNAIETAITVRVFNIMDFVLFSSTALLFVFAALIHLRTIKGKQTIHYLLPAFMLTRCLIIFYFFWAFNEPVKALVLSHYSKSVYQIPSPLFFLEGPLLFWYIKSLTDSDFSFTLKDFLPVAIYLICLLLPTPTVFFPAPETTYSIYRSLWFFIAGSVVTAIYGGFSIVYIEQYKTTLENAFSSLDNIDYGWLRMLALMFFTDWLLRLCVQLAPGLGMPDNIHEPISHFYGFYGLAIIVILIFYSLIYSGPTIKMAELYQNNTKRKIKDEDIRRLEEAMQNDKIYLINNITLDNLANKLSIPTKTLSNLINRHYKMNFYEFINSYRVETAKTLLSDPTNQQKTIMEIYEQAGFNSKSTFNLLFKKHVGVTPTKYRTEQANKKS